MAQSITAPVSRRLLGNLGALALLAAGIAACGTQKVDRAKAEKLIEDNLQAGGPTTIHCPEDVNYEVGKTFECNATVIQISTKPSNPFSYTPPNPPTPSSYTITVHMIGGGKLQVGPDDVQKG